MYIKNGRRGKEEIKEKRIFCQAEREKRENDTARTTTAGTVW